MLAKTNNQVHNVNIKVRRRKASRIASGMYFCKITAGNYRAIKRMRKVF
jgi:hypothetical protein